VDLVLCFAAFSFCFAIYIFFDIVVAQHTNLSLCSPFNLPNGSARGMTPFSLPQTGPTQSQTSGPFWSEGEQNFQDPLSPHENAHNGFTSMLPRRRDPARTMAETHFQVPPGYHGTQNSRPLRCHGNCPQIQ
jgi:hypothetical protein